METFPKSEEVNNAKLTIYATKAANSRMYFYMRLLLLTGLYTYGVILFSAEYHVSPIVCKEIEKKLWEMEKDLDSLKMLDKQYVDKMEKLEEYYENSQNVAEFRRKYLPNPAPCPVYDPKEGFAKFVINLQAAQN